MPVRTTEIVPPLPANAQQPGVTRSLLYNGSRFQGQQKSKGNSYDVEVVLQVSDATVRRTWFFHYVRVQLGSFTCALVAGGVPAFLDAQSLTIATFRLWRSAN